jgi:hypothetical protein
MTQRSFHRRQWLRNLFFLAAAGAIGVVAFGSRTERRLVLTALDAREASALCAKEGLPLADFWQRAEVMGLGGVVLREESIGEAARRGGLLSFSRDEIEKWKAAGLVAPSVPLKAETVWVKDGAVAEELLAAAARRGVQASSSTSAGFHLVRFPESLAESGTLDGSGVGLYDPAFVKSLEGRRLARVLVPLSAPEGRLNPVAVRWRPGAVEAEAASSRDDGSRMMEARVLPLGASQSRVLKAVYSHPSRLLVLGLSEPTVEANFERLRGILQDFKRRGLPAGFPESAPEAVPPLDALQRRLMKSLVLLFGVFGPLLAARAGLVGLKRTRLLALSRFPVASPVLQLAAGLAAAGVSAAFIGLAARSCFASLGVLRPLALWARASLVLPLAVALLTLYTIDLDDWARRLSSTVRWSQLLGLLAAAAAALLLIEPRRLFGAAHLAGVFALLQRPELPWWWDWRWREALVGWPCLMQSFFLINWRMECPDCATLDEHPLKDPRTWFLLGLLAPIGIVVSVGLQQAPRDAALAQTAWAALAGCALGVLGVAARLRGLHGTKGPGHHRTIDLDDAA